MNAQVLALLRPSKLTDMIENHFKNIVGLKPVIKDSLEDLQMFLELLGEAELVIIDGTSYAADLDAFLLHIYEKNITVKNILIIGVVPRTFDHKSLFISEDPKLILDFFNKIFQLDEQKLSEFISIPVESLVHFKFLPFDLYIKLSDNKFVKRFHACESIEKTALKLLKLKGVKDFYFNKTHNREFATLLLNNMLNGIDRDYLSFEEKYEVTTEVFQTTMEIVQSMGFPSRIVKVCESVMKCIKDDVINGKNHFSVYLEHLKKPEYSFNYRYIELTSYFATQIIEEFEVFASSNYSRLVIFSALFCDVTLKEPKWVHIRNAQQLMAMPGETIKEINNHALKAAEMVQGYKDAPAGADKIIRQHHGSLNGVGFSDQSFSAICPLSRCLIVSQSLAYEILSRPDTSIKQSITDVIAKFRGSPLQAMVERFESNCKLT